MKAISEEKKSRLQRISEVIRERTGGLTGFAVEAGSAAIVITVCWAIVEIVKGLLT